MVNLCCNPLNKSKHKFVYKNLHIVTENWSSIYSNLIDQYICSSCRRAILKNNVPVNVNQEKEIKEEPEKEASVEENYEMDIEKTDPTISFKQTDRQGNMKKVSRILQEFNANEDKSKRRKVSNVDHGIVESLLDVLENRPKKSESFVMDENYIKEIQNALAKETVYAKKVEILTCLPEISIRKMQSLFKVSRRMASKAKKLRKTEGFKTTTKRKKSKKLISNETKQKVNDFYLSDDVSRMMPGCKDFISVKTDRGRQHEQKRLLLNNLKDLHAIFKKRFPDVHIGLSEFRKLRPKECIMADKAGCHNVCVCQIHQNLKLKFVGLKREPEKRNVIFVSSYREAFNDIICKNPLQACYFLECNKCPGTAHFCEKLRVVCADHCISHVSYKEWKKTDRGDFVDQTNKIDEFIEIIKKDLRIVLKHDYIAKSQNAYLTSVKENLEDGEFLVTLDFSENYSFKIQDAVQSFHWSNTQATLHPYAIYCKVNGKLVRHCFVVISEEEKHDTASVHLFNRKLFSYLRNIYSDEKIKKIIYFSDGAASQYKNKSNFVNLINHKDDFNAEAEWHFFATSHGKGACDGIGGTVKREARKCSLQTKSITSAKELYDWACTFFKNIQFAFCTRSEHVEEVKLLSDRFKKAQTVKGTREYHSFLVKDFKTLKCKYVSSCPKYELKSIY